MNTVVVKRDELLEKVTENRNNHRAIFEEAQTKYREFVIGELDSMLADAKAGRKVRRSVSLPEPEDHTRDYDRVIMMLKMSVDDEIELMNQEFENYVMDNWGWNASFAANTMRYTSGNF